MGMGKKGEVCWGLGKPVNFWYSFANKTIQGSSKTGKKGRVNK